MFGSLVSRCASRVNMVRRLSVRQMSGLSELAITSQLDRAVPLDIGRNRIKLLAVPAEARARWSTALQNVPSPYADFDSHCSAAYTAILSHSHPLLVEAIRDFHSSPPAPGALVIVGLPLDPLLPSTPAKGEPSAEKLTFISEGCLSGVARLIGEPFGYASEKNGQIIHNVCPVQNRETVQSNESSNVELSLHVENAYFENRPDYLALYCLRQDHKKVALTSVADIRSILSEMDPTDVAELRKPAFIVPSPSSHHEAMGGEKWSPPRPVFESFDHPNLMCRFPGMKALNLQAQKALDSFEKIARQLGVLHHIALPPGSILLLNNRKVVHGRTRFEPRYDGLDRWLQRVYIRAGHSRDVK